MGAPFAVHGRASLLAVLPVTHLNLLPPRLILARAPEARHAARQAADPARPAGAVVARCATKTRETITFGCLRRKAIAKYRMPAPVAIGYRQDFELTA